MTRFMMSLEEAVQLVMYAFKNSNSGEIFIPKTSAAKIEDVADTLIDIFKSSCKKKIIGTRHGEKNHETLITKEEMSRAKEYNQYYVIKHDDRDLNYKPYFSKGKKISKLIEEYSSDKSISLKGLNLKLYGYSFKNKVREDYGSFHIILLKD